jgi:type II secretory pathway pseudopilin PulG
MLSLPTLPGRLHCARDERGFTLIETLVAMVTGVIVTGALFAILEFAVHQTSRISQVAQATQVSRTAMTHIVDELHSACLTTGFTPIGGESTLNKMVLENGYSEGSQVPGVYTTKGGAKLEQTEGVRKDTIEWEEKKDYLIDNVQLGTGGEAGEYAYSTTKTPVRLAEHVTQTEIVNAKKVTETLPIFRYYEYAKEASTGTTEAASTLVPITPALKTTTETLGTERAARVASVQVSFRTAPYTKEVKLGAASEATTSADLTTQTTFAFSAPNSESTIEAGPCE